MSIADKILITQTDLKNLELINQAKISIVEQFGVITIDNGVQIPSGGSLFTGLFGKTPTEDEQILRIEMINIAKKYIGVTAEQATEKLKQLQVDVNTIRPGTSESIMAGKKEVLSVARDEKYPIWLIALFCIPILGQIGFIAFKCIEACLPKNQEADDPLRNNANIV